MRNETTAAATGEARQFRLTSTPMIHSPGIVNWLKAVYRTDPKNAVHIFNEGWPTLPAGLGELLLRDEIDSWTEDDGNTLVVLWTGEELSATEVFDTDGLIISERELRIRKTRFLDDC